MKTTEIEQLKIRIEKALEDFTNGRACMHVPAQETDVDLVLADCLTALPATVAVPDKWPDCSSAGFGTYDGCIPVVTPSGKIADIDACLVSEVVGLWQQGITTIESCCGHGKASSYIAVIPDDDGKMLALGYIPSTESGAQHVFYSKTSKHGVKDKSSAANAIPEGYVLMPKQIHLDADAVECICSQGGDGGYNYGDFTDVILWVGEVESDDGSKTYGLNVSSADYPEDGSINLYEFAAQIRSQSEQVKGCIMTNNDEMAQLKVAATAEVNRVQGVQPAYWDMVKPELILSLLAERDADKKRIADLEKLKEQYCIWWEDAEKTSSGMEVRIAELEARTVSVKLPEPATEGGRGYRQKVIWVLKEALFDAGINLEVGE